MRAFRGLVVVVLVVVVVPKGFRNGSRDLVYLILLEGPILGIKAAKIERGGGDKARIADKGVTRGGFLFFLAAGGEFVHSFAWDWKWN